MMARIGETLQAERFLIFEESGHGTVSSTYEWRRDTAESVMKDTQNVPIASLKPLYDHFEHNHMLILHPDFQPMIQGLTSLVSGHLIQSGRSLGFTEVVNPASESFSSAIFLLSSLTSVLAIMLRNRDMIHRVETYSYRDQLTGVGNRRALLSFIRTIPDGTSLAFFFGDINGLKVENDTKGHEAGDLLIKKAATVLVAAAGPERVFRMGGDEFLLVVENITKQEADAMHHDRQPAAAAARYLRPPARQRRHRLHRPSLAPPQHRHHPLRSRRPHVREQTPDARAPQRILKCVLGTSGQANKQKGTA